MTTTKKTAVKTAAKKTAEKQHAPVEVIDKVSMEELILAYLSKIDTQQAVIMNRLGALILRHEPTAASDQELIRQLKASVAAFDPTTAIGKEATKPIRQGEFPDGNGPDKGVNTPQVLSTTFDIGDHAWYAYVVDGEDAKLYHVEFTGRSKSGLYTFDFVGTDEEGDDTDGFFPYTAEGKKEAQAYFDRKMEELRIAKADKARRRARMTVDLIGNAEIKPAALAKQLMKDYTAKDVPVLASIVGLNAFTDLKGVQGDDRFKKVADAAVKMAHAKGSAKTLKEAKEYLRVNAALPQPGRTEFDENGAKKPADTVSPKIGDFVRYKAKLRPIKGFNLRKGAKLEVGDDVVWVKSRLKRVGLSPKTQKPVWEAEAAT